MVVDNTSGSGGSGGPGTSAPGQAGAGGAGAGIFNGSALTLTDCTISGNACGAGGVGGACWWANSGTGGQGGSGGGIYNAGTMRVNASMLSWNFTGTGGDGGAGQNNSTNAPGDGGGAGTGGGLFNEASATIGASTIFSNICANGGASRPPTNTEFGAFQGGRGGDGGGVYNFGRLDLVNCTISVNACGNGGDGSQGGTGSSGGSGGGILNAGTLLQTACTITENVFGFGFPTSTPGGGHTMTIDVSGGGICNASNATATVRNSIIAGNRPATYLVTTPGDGVTLTNYYGDVSGNFITRGFNLIGVADEDSTGFANDVAADQVGTSTSLIDPLLGPLEMNGGPTPTQALLPGSPAIDQGDAFGLRTDQRGDRRPHNLPSIPNALQGDGSDIGAFELQ